MDPSGIWLETGPYKYEEDSTLEPSYVEDDTITDQQSTVNSSTKLKQSQSSSAQQNQRPIQEQSTSLFERKHSHSFSAKADTRQIEAPIEHEPSMIPIVFIENNHDTQTGQSNQENGFSSNRGGHEEPVEQAPTDKKNNYKRSIAWASVVMGTLTIIAAVIAAVCGSGSCKAADSKTSSDIIPDSQNLHQTEKSLFPTPTGEPTQVKQPKPFWTTEELYEAVDEYLTIAGTENATISNVALKYGYPIGNWDVSNLDNFSRVFDPYRQINFFEVECDGTDKFNEDLSGWDMSLATSLFAMFACASAFEGRGISDWDVSSVKNMSSTFYMTSQLTADISMWNVSQVVTMKAMFQGCNKFRGNLSAWDVSNVESLAGTFYSATEFSSDLSQWNTDKVTDMQATFRGANRFNSDLSNWKTTNVKNMDFTFSYTYDFDSDLSKWDTSNVESMESMFYQALAFNSSLPWNTSKVRSMENMFAWSNFNGDIFNWNVDRVTSMKGMFLEDVYFTGDVSNWICCSSLESMESTFNFVTLFDSDLSRWKTPRLTSLRGTFLLASSFKGNVSTWDTSHVTDMTGTFNGAAEFMSDLSKWDTSKVTSTFGLFGAASLFASDLSKWDTSQVTDMRGMFAYASSFSSDLSQWNTSKVKDMLAMFESASNFDSDISDWDVSQVTDMSQMFMSASRFNSSLLNWNIGRVSKMNLMFYNASSFAQNLCPWRSIVNNSTGTDNMFLLSGCPDASDPINFGSWCHPCP